MKSAVIIFTKVPIPGLVKIRLTQNTCLTELDSAKIAEAMLKDTISIASKTSTDIIQVGYFPDEHKAKLHEIVDNIRIDGNLSKPVDFILQNGLNFDQRFGSVVHEAFRRDIDTLAILGADLPFLDFNIINLALGSLLEHFYDNPVIIGPSLEGGIYLIGLTKAFNPNWFSEYHLFTGGMELSQFANFCNCNELLLISLPPYGDIDLQEDLVTLISYINLLKNSKESIGFYFPHYTAKIIEELHLDIVGVKDQTRRRKIAKKDDPLS
ncbi:MAG: DUF2064 domain-containing protein [Candidatus Thorarchaeota archaeon]